LIEAIRCSEIRPVPAKTVEKQQVLQLHRLRDQYKRTRNARLIFLRSAFREFGMPLPNGLQDCIRALHIPLPTSSNDLPVDLANVYGCVLEEVEKLQKNALLKLTRKDPIARGLLGWQ
jgi:hypothetical protein